MTLFFKQAHTNVHISAHVVLGPNMRDEAGTGQEVIYLVAGCFWDVGKALWGAPGVVTTATGYMDEYLTNPTYKQVCSRSTGHAETVRIIFGITLTSVVDFVRLSSEIHDPTQVGGQGSDIGDQYRFAIWTITPEQLRDAIALRTTYQEVLARRGFGPIQMVIPPAPDVDSTARFWYAEDYHQRYLFKNPGGYEYHACIGIACPAPPHE